jgi:hypothetical protein
MKKILLLLLAFVLLGIVLMGMKSNEQRPISAADLNDVPELSVLIVTPDPAIGYAEGIKTLLSDSGIRTDIVSWEQATSQLVDGFDVLVVTGLGRSPRGAKIRLDYHKPIVAYGPYGCKYLGMSHLKNGHPYT